jgi:hypothetical protein
MLRISLKPNLYRTKYGQNKKSPDCSGDFILNYFLGFFTWAWAAASLATGTLNGEQDT